MHAQEYAVNLRNDCFRWWNSNKGKELSAHWPGDSSTALDRTMAQVLNFATPIYVTDEMCQLWYAAAPSMPAEPLMREDLPFPTGFAVLATPLKLRDARGMSYDVRAFSWGTYTNLRDSRYPAEMGVQVGLYVDEATDPEAGKDWRVDAQMRIDGKVIFFHDSFFRFGQRWDDGSLYDVTSASEAILRQDVTTDLEEAIERARGYQIEGNRSIVAFWRLIWQRIPIFVEYRPPRHVARRSPPQAPRTLVTITLRRPRSKPTHGENPEPTNWSHRWLVDGHWRNQYYPSVKAHRQIWIAPYVKGPDDKPFIEKDKVYLWRR